MNKLTFMNRVKHLLYMALRPYSPSRSFSSAIERERRRKNDATLCTIDAKDG